MTYSTLTKYASEILGIHFKAPQAATVQASGQNGKSAFINAAGLALLNICGN